MATEGAQPAQPVPAPPSAQPASVRSRLAPSVPWLLWAIAAAEAALLASAPLLFPSVFGGLDGLAATLEVVAFLVALAVTVMAFATAGLLVTRQQPRNLVGWVMLAGGPALGAVFVGYVIGLASLETDPAAGAWFALLGVVGFGPALFLLGSALPSVFPDGRPLPGWPMRGLRLAGAGILIGSVLAAVAPGPVEVGIDVANPLGVSALPAATRDVANGVTALALVLGVVVGVATLLVRFRQSAAEARHQLKWFLFAVAIWAVVLPISLAIGENWSAAVALLVLTLVPAAVVVAIRRYRLYEIDVLINRTLVYVPLVGIVAGLYAALVALLQRSFTALTGDTSDAAAIISALVLAAVFTPIRNAIQAAVDGRFKPVDPTTASPYEDPEFRAAVEAIVREVTGRNA